MPKKKKRKLPSGMTTRPGRDGYYADFTIGGRRDRRFLSTDFQAACCILDELKARAHKADFGLLDNNFLLSELRQQWLTHCKQVLKPRTVRCYEDWLKNIIPQISVLKVSQVTTSLILNYRGIRAAKGLSPRSINGEVGCLINMLNWGVEHKLIGSNPIACITPLRHDNPKVGRALMNHEVVALLDASPEHWRNIWFTFLVTGMRLSELIDLRFSDLDFENRELTVRQNVAKNHTERRIPMDDRLYETLSKLEEGRESRQPGKGRAKKDNQKVLERFSKDHVFVSGQNTPLTNRRNVYRAFVNCCRKAGIELTSFDSSGKLEHVDIHSLRRTFATNLITSGADPKTVQELLGHKMLTMTMKLYTKIRSQNKRQAIGQLSYGTGVTSPGHILHIPELPVSVPSRHQSVTEEKESAQDKAAKALVS